MDLLKTLEDLYSQQHFKSWAIESLSGAVRIPTESFDDMEKPGKDERWDIFADLHVYLEARFPLVFTSLAVKKVNTYGLVLYWQGSDPSLKPLMLTGHQDVVPVPDGAADLWKHPPYSGHYDGTYIWGRGSVDDKSTTISTLTTVETLLKHEFQPKRSVILAFGIDEESGGLQGAGAIAKYLLNTYGADSMAIIVDEGGGYMDYNNITLAAPMTAEKGRVDVLIEVTTLGGHSSMPPPHTGIGYLSKLISALEDNPFPVELVPGAALQAVQCLAAYDEALPKAYRELAAKAATDARAREQMKQILLGQPGMHDLFAARMGTTQAVDISQGGAKVNALPERSMAIVDHRIADWSSVAAVYEHYIDVLAPVTARFNLTLDAFGLLPNDTRPSAGYVRLAPTFHAPLEPAPIPPTFGAPAWDVLAGTIRATLSSSQRADSLSTKTPYVGPDVMMGNTDTQYYWNLTSNIYRYSHMGYLDLYNGAHTINEAIKAEGFLEMIRFHSRLILNADEAGAL
ncbi:Zn-dependent exopeptidase [Peniophora sp. CONT]|nr:Zn-dependent exopeptidase [Peniophora sp. CONT]